MQVAAVLKWTWACLWHQQAKHHGLGLSAPRSQRHSCKMRMRMRILTRPEYSLGNLHP